MIPIELEVEFLRMMLEAKVLENVWTLKRYEELALIDEKRMEAFYHMQSYQRKIAQGINKKARLRKIKEGDRLLKQAWPIPFHPRGKFKPNWDGPYIVKKILLGGATRISNLDGNEF